MRKGIDSWLTPSGEIIEVGDCMHNEYAYKILEEEMGLGKLQTYMQKHHMSSAYQVLHFRGWVRIKYNTAYPPNIKILGDCVDLTAPRKNTINPPMNSRQLAVAKELCEEFDTPFHIAINDRRFW